MSLLGHIKFRPHETATLLLGLCPPDFSIYPYGAMCEDVHSCLFYGGREMEARSVIIPGKWRGKVRWTYTSEDNATAESNGPSGPE